MAKNNFFISFQIYCSYDQCLKLDPNFVEAWNDKGYNLIILK